MVDTPVETPEESLQHVDGVEVGISGNGRGHGRRGPGPSGQTDLRVHDTGHVVKEG
jgi:hypothetical protein